MKIVIKGNENILNKDAFVKEYVKASSQIHRLCKRPNAIIIDYYSYYKVMLLLNAILLLYFIAMAFFVGFTIISIMPLLLFLMFRSIVYLKTYNNYLKRSLENNKPSEATIDEEGVEHNSQGIQCVKVYWDNIACLRILNESMVFIPKEMGTNSIFINKVYKSDIVELLNKEHPQIPIIDLNQR